MVYRLQVGLEWCARAGLGSLSGLPYLIVNVLVPPPHACRQGPNGGLAVGLSNGDAGGLFHALIPALITGLTAKPSHFRISSGMTWKSSHVEPPKGIQRLCRVQVQGDRLPRWRAGPGGGWL